MAGYLDRSHAHADHFWHARVHCAGASETIGGEPYPGSRCLQSRRGPVRSLHWSPAFSGRTRVRGDPTSIRKTCTEIAFAHSRIRSRFGNDLHEMFGARTAGALS